MNNRIKKFIALSSRGRVLRTKFESNGYYYYNGMRATFQECLKFLPRSRRALDIGAGFGNETKELLKRDFSVVATESNPEAFRYLRNLAQKNSKLTVLHDALPAMSSKDMFGLVVCEMVLHFLSEEDIKISVKKIQERTIVGGINVVSTYVDSAPLNSDKSMKDYYNYLLPEGALEDFYEGWEVLYYEERSNVQRFISARIIARRKY